MKRLNSGFTLIELMIAVAIIGILVAVGVPQYQNYVARSQAVEGINLAGGIKTALAEYYNTNGKFPKDTTDPHVELGLESAASITGKYVTSVTVSNDGLGTITAEFGSGNHAGKFIRLTAIAVASGSIYFDCDSDIEESYRPKECVEGTSGPTALEIAQAALVTANEALTIAESNYDSYVSANKGTWPPVNAATCKLDTTGWHTGLTRAQRRLKIVFYLDIRKKCHEAKGESTLSSNLDARRDRFLNSLTAAQKTEYDARTNEVLDATQAVTDAQQAVTDLGG